MGFEIDFLAVGTESSGGDAIAVRYGNLYGPRSEQTVIVIDGGYTECGTAMVEHLKSRFNTERVDIVVSTHPDQDHVTGLEVVLEQMDVDQLWMHQPWSHSASLAQARASSFRTANVEGKLAKALGDVSDLEGIAHRRGVPIVEPWTGLATSDGCFEVLGPSKEFYENTLGLAQSRMASVLKGAANIFSTVKEVTTVFESLEHETLHDGGVTSPQNNASVISCLCVDGMMALFTADAGAPGLDEALTVLEGSGFISGSIALVQVPHHGSRRNVGPTVLNRLLGPIGRASAGSACVSAPAKNPEAKHPAKKVTNAFIRRGYTVVATQGRSISYQKDAPERSDWKTAVAPVPFYNQVEE